ncbi:hypothetical protein SO574_21635 (plasmid) [Vibrio alfacsensis]|uniref:hypothetical protein n=1 Tax=Vibrio alfacsensis TaxID=1074311 RepID=UPI002ADDC747|nr:hypothetical protein [Vibrio alfacsensis]WQE79052.1 hypothetical protein SO574_21635 [Vibrio alfacsensis]
MDKSAKIINISLKSKYFYFLLLFLLVTSISSLFWLPIFTDEVTWLQMTGKYLQHEGYDVTLTPQCSSTHKSLPPFYMQPYRVLSSLISYQLANPSYFRIIAIVKILVIAIVAYLTLKVTLPNSPANERLNPILMTFSMGGLLTFFMYLRPEVSILILTLLYLYFVMLYQEGVKRPYILVLLSFVYFVLLVSVHQKTLLLAPLILVILFREIENKRTLYSLLVVVAFVFIGWSSYKYYSDFFSCEKNTVVSNYWSDHGLPFYLLKESNVELFIRNISWRLQEGHQIFSNILFVNHSQRNFPPLPDYEQFLILAYIASIAGFVLLVLMLIGYFQYIFRSSNGDRKSKNRKIYAGYFIVMTIAIAIAQKENYFYESIIPLFFISLFGWSYIWSKENDNRYSCYIKNISISSAITCVSFLVFCSISFNQEWKDSMYDNRHPKTFSHFDFSETVSEVDKLITLKGLKNNDIWLVDELVALTLPNKKNVEIIHFSKIGVNSMYDILVHANTSFGIFNCHYLKGLDLKNIEIDKYEDICIVTTKKK